MLQQADITVNQLVEVVQVLYRGNYGLQRRWMVQKLKSSIQDVNLVFEQRMNIAYSLYKGITLKSFRRWIIQWLMDKMDEFTQTVEQRVEVVRMLHLCNLDDLSEKQQLIQELGAMLRRTDLTVEQRLKVAQTLYLYGSDDLDDSQERRQVTLLLVELLKHTTLTIEQQVLVAQSLYLCSIYKSEERQMVMQRFVEFLKNQELAKDLRFQIALLPLTVEDANHADRVWSIQAILALADKEFARIHIKKCWAFVDDEAQVSDIPFIAELAKEEILSTEIRDAIYVSLENMIPKFGNGDVHS